MPTKGALTLERLQAFGAVAAEGARTRLASAGESPCEHLTCEYRGVATQDEECATNEIPARLSTIAYQWYFRVGGHHEDTVPHKHAKNPLLVDPVLVYAERHVWILVLEQNHRCKALLHEPEGAEAGRRGCSTRKEEDPITRVHGTAAPSTIPESIGWWKKQQRDLCAISDEAELGLMQAMVTVNTNINSPEMLSAIRRGPFATPTEEEFIEYLLKRKPRDKARPEFEAHSLEHVLSFQRRVHAMKSKFMIRNSSTPLGILQDWWDRTPIFLVGMFVLSHCLLVVRAKLFLRGTEAQNRAALHSHILCWFRLRRSTAPPLGAIEKSTPGNEQKQRPRTSNVDAFRDKEYREDNMYHHAEVARVVTEMVRPHVPDPSEGGLPWGGFASSHLRIAGLARIIQTKLYLHRCSKKYCLQNRASCRFFFPWPQMPHQQFDSHMDRVACQRRCEEDDQAFALACVSRLASVCA